MSIMSLFQLTLDLGQLLPTSNTLRSAWDSTRAIAREIQASGSDFFAEEALASLLGRCHVSHLFASTFRTVVGQDQSQTLLQAGVMLVFGPGPTVTRALTQSRDDTYFAMIVQCKCQSLKNLRVTISEDGHLITGGC